MPVSNFLHKLNVLRRWLRFQNYLATEANYKEYLNRGCEYCGSTPICQECDRCYDRNCNAGCIFCNYPKETEVCNCCGQEIKN